MGIPFAGIANVYGNTHKTRAVPDQDRCRSIEPSPGVSHKWDSIDEASAPHPANCRTRPRLWRGSGTSWSNLDTGAGHSLRKRACPDQATWQQHVAKHPHPDRVLPASLGCPGSACLGERSNPILLSTPQELSQLVLDQLLSRNFAEVARQRGNQLHSRASMEGKQGPKEGLLPLSQLVRETVRQIIDRDAQPARPLASLDEIPTLPRLWGEAEAVARQARKGRCLQQLDQRKRPTQKTRGSKSLEQSAASLLLGSSPNTRRSHD